MSHAARPPWPAILHTPAAEAYADERARRWADEQRRAYERAVAETGLHAPIDADALDAAA